MTRDLAVAVAARAAARDNGPMDPYAVLGLDAGASVDEAARAYRELAKRFHPDRAGDAGWRRWSSSTSPTSCCARAQRPGAGGGRWRRRGPAGERGAGARRRGPGAWLPEAMRRALGRELLEALEADEPVALVTPAATWASPSTLLAVTDRRLLWLLDDAVGNRVRSLRFRDTAHAEQQLVWPRRTRARLSVEPRFGAKRWTFSDLRPATAEAIAGPRARGVAARAGRDHGSGAMSHPAVRRRAMIF